jgi:hypothetical protein
MERSTESVVVSAGFASASSATSVNVIATSAAAKARSFGRDSLLTARVAPRISDLAGMNSSLDAKLRHAKMLGRNCVKPQFQSWPRVDSIVSFVRLSPRKFAMRFCKVVKKRMILEIDRA